MRPPRGPSAAPGAVVGIQAPAANLTWSYPLPARKAGTTSVSSSPSGVAVASTMAAYLCASA
ncbi:MAG: hypothetical protein NTV55_13385 [Planctomycetota bacterium]|nr:hypothetical protein [Planctomycetota bacterium]